MSEPRPEHKPYIPANKTIPEFTAQALILGVLLAILMCAANTYLGLFAGMTVSASIPAAVISMGILRGLMKRGTILENNIVQTIASTGESLAAGIIFTVPALILTGAWDHFHYGEVTLIALLGGTLGILFMIPIRRALIVEGDKELTYPEGVACSEVLQAGEKGGEQVQTVFAGLGLGALFKFLVDAMAFIPGSFKKAFVLKGAIFSGGWYVSPALLSVGYIIGLEVSVLVFLGGFIAWGVTLPILSVVIDIPADAGADLVSQASWVWSNYIKYMGVGAMVVGGIASIFSVRKGLAKGLAALSGITRETSDVRTDRDMGFMETTPLFLLAAIGTFGLYWALTSLAHGIVMSIIMIIAAFFFVAVSSYIVGLVGSSNNPVSGMTITTVLFASGLLLVFGFEGKEGIIAALGIAGVVCCAACTAGDVSQDLKTGYEVGATPRYQQWAEIIGVAIPAFFIAPVLTILHSAHTIGSETLSAPQAGLFASLAEGFFGEGTIPWTMVIIGAVLGLFLVMFNELLKAQGSKFRTHCMPVAVGLYLPIALSFPIFIGGLIRWLIIRNHSDKPAAALKAAEGRGTLAASGLIAGEAVMGILVAGLVAANIAISWTDLLGIICLGIVIWWVWKTAVGRRQAADEAAEFSAGFEKPDGGIDEDE